MTKLHYLHTLFNPNSIAVIGASERPQSVGAIVFSNLLKSEFIGKLYAVNPKHQEVQGNKCYSSIHDIPNPIDLALITTPAATVPQVLTECGKKDVHTVVILSAGFSETNEQGKQLEKSLLEIAQQYHIRLIGPNCLGIMRPSIGLNATFATVPVLTGNLALVSQSGALCVAILDWAINKQVGFSTVFSLGNAVDIDFGDILDYLALDAKTQGILLYIEGVHHARNFMSGLRVASRLKPVIVLKAGRKSQGLRAAMSHTGVLVGSDDVFDAALRRAGAVRVMSIEQLFSAAEIFSSGYRLKGDRLAIITNGGGAGVMASDRASDLRISMPDPSPNTLSHLNAVLPKHWSHHNPIDILGDATPDRYREVIETCLKDENYDGVITVLVPVSMSQPLEVAQQVVAMSKQYDKPILACWMGQAQVKSSQELFAHYSVPCFATPEAAVEAFSYLENYYHNQQLLLQLPEPISDPTQSNIAQARLIIDSALSENRKILTTIESKGILKAFGIPVTQPIEAHTASEAAAAAESIGFPVVMKINSPDITHKREVGGVQLNIIHAEAVRRHFDQIIDRAQKQRPDAKILGVTIERMYKTPHDRELMIGVLQDKVFGPAISFGAGGVFVEILQDRAIALPPLNSFIARNLISKTRISKLLDTFRNMPAVNREGIENVLLSVSEMVCELPQIQEMDINPLIANEREVIAVDARIGIRPLVPSATSYSHMAIYPYPTHLISPWKLSDGTDLIIRPVRPEDALSMQEFVSSLSSRSKHFRFMKEFQELTPQMLIRLTQIDYDRDMVLLVTYKQDSRELIIGMAHYVINPDKQTCDFALVVADAWQNKGIGFYLMTSLMKLAKAKKLKTIQGEILSSNLGMLKLVKALGFSLSSLEGDADIVVAVKSL